MAQQIWLMKSEPEVYSIDHLKKDQRTWWEGVRNYKARNFMQKDMQVGDTVLFYHSNAEPPGIAGIARVSKAAQPDQTQFDKKSEYYEPAATKEKPRWYCVEVEFVAKLPQFISLSALRETKALSKMLVLQKGQRLSIQPVTEAELQIIKKMAKL